MAFNYLSFLLALFVSCIGLIAADSDTSSKASYSYYAITGVNTGVNASSGYRPTRLPIQVMQKNYPMILSVILPSLIAHADQAHSVISTSSPWVPCKVLQQVTGHPGINMLVRVESFC
jgi:hypothetical protein